MRALLKVVEQRCEGLDVHAAADAGKAACCSGSPAQARAREALRADVQLHDPAAPCVLIAEGAQHIRAQRQLIPGRELAAHQAGEALLAPPVVADIAEAVVERVVGEAAPGFGKAIHPAAHRAYHLIKAAYAHALKRGELIQQLCLRAEQIVPAQRGCKAFAARERGEVVRQRGTGRGVLDIEPSQQPLCGKLRCGKTLVHLLPYSLGVLSVYLELHTEYLFQLHARPVIQRSAHELRIYLAPGFEFLLVPRATAYKLLRHAAYAHRPVLVRIPEQPYLRHIAEMPVGGDVRSGKVVVVIYERQLLCRLKIQPLRHRGSQQIFLVHSLSLFLLRNFTSAGDRQAA